MCAALWTTRLRQGLPGGQPRPEEEWVADALGVDVSGDTGADGGAAVVRPRGLARRLSPEPMAYARCDSPFGAVHVAATADGVCAVSLYEDEAHFRARLAPPRWDEPAAEAVAARAVAELAEYFAGRRQAFGVPIVLSAATDFDRRVLDAIAAIPHGETRTYGALARALGSPGASRAVGHACGRNPVPLLIACHRVVRGDGGMGGFGAGGPTVKTALLAMERAGRE